MHGSSEFLDVERHDLGAGGGRRHVGQQLHAHALGRGVEAHFNAGQDVAVRVGAGRERLRGIFGAKTNDCVRILADVGDQHLGRGRSGERGGE